MSEYVLDKNNVLVLNGRVFVLARKERATTNHVCRDCSLNKMCNYFRAGNNFLKLCMKPDLDGRWFFLDCLELSESENEEILLNIIERLDIDF